MVEYIAETKSTNSDLTDRLANGNQVVEGDWLVADRQTAGRGRLGRNWTDGSGNFMGSTVVYPGASDPPRTTLALLAGIAIYEVCSKFAPECANLALKWPNDLLIGRAKLAGILLEGHGDAVIVGIGVNLVDAPSLPDRETIHLGDIVSPPERNTFAEQLAAQFRTELDRWRTYGLESLVRRWLSGAHPVGTRLSVQGASDNPAEGSFDGLADDGSLLLRLADGSQRAIHAGDVILN